MEGHEIEIKFVIQPEGFGHSRRFLRSLTLIEMKVQIEEDLRIPVASMKLLYLGQGECWPSCLSVFAPTSLDTCGCQRRRDEEPAALGLQLLSERP